MIAWFSFSLLVLLGFAHSLLGEAAVIGPLLRDPRWDIGIPRWAADRILRFAWHLTTLAWFGLAASLVGVPVGIAMGVTCLVSGGLVFVLLRGHLSWPIFTLAGLTALHTAAALPAAVRLALVAAGVAVAAAAALLHTYWAFGGRWGFERAVPTRADGAPAFRPGAAACLAVTGVLLVFCALLVATTTRVGPPWVLALTGAALLVLVVRAVGDGRQVGFSKTDRSTAFARADDAVFTPLVVVLALGAAMALLPAAA